jgi:hypothetical protein
VSETARELHDHLSPDLIGLKTSATRKESNRGIRRRVGCPVSAKALLEELRGRDLELTTDGDRLRPSRRSSPAASRKIRACLGMGDVSPYGEFWAGQQL